MSVTCMYLEMIVRKIYGKKECYMQKYSTSEIINMSVTCMYLEMIVRKIYGKKKYREWLINSNGKISKSLCINQDVFLK